MPASASSNTNHIPAAPAAIVRSSQIMCGALIGGVVMFFALTLVIKGTPNPPQLAYLGVIIAAAVMGMRFVIPDMVAKAKMTELLRHPDDHLDGRLFETLMTKMIIGLALLEGGAFFNLIAYMLERQIWTLAVVGVLVLLMAMQFPTLQAFQQTVDNTKRDLWPQT